jgi:hypothetical protein
VLNRRPMVLRASSARHSPKGAQAPPRPPIHALRRSRQNQRRVTENTPLLARCPKRKHASRYLDLDIYHNVVALPAHQSTSLPAQSTTSSYSPVPLPLSLPLRLLLGSCLVSGRLPARLLACSLAPQPTNCAVCHQTRTDVSPLALTLLTLSHTPTPGPPRNFKQPACTSPALPHPQVAQRDRPFSIFPLWAILP